MGKKAQGKKGQDGLNLPKSIAGVKVPKVLRHVGGLGAVLDSPLGRRVLADALVAAAAAAAAALVKHPEAVRDAGRAVADTGSDAAAATKDAAQGAAGTVVGAVTEVARQVLPSSLVGGDESHGPDEFPPLMDENRHGKKAKPRHKASEH